MKLLTQDILRQLPKLGEVKNPEDPLVVVKFFYPDFHWTWYGIEFDGRDIFYGLVDGDFLEFGSFSLQELQADRGKLGCPIERDRHFEPVRASALYSQLQASRRE